MKYSINNLLPPPPPVKLYSNFILIILFSLGIMGNVYSQSLHSNQYGTFLPDQDSISASVCGDLTELSNTIQQDYENYQNNLPSSFKSIDEYDPDAIFTCGSFRVIYEEIDENTGYGFDNSLLGAARRNTLCAVLNYVEEVVKIHPNAQPTILVRFSTLPAAALAGASPVYSSISNHDFGEDAGIYDGFVARHIQTGIDPDPQLEYDGVLSVNFASHQFFNMDDPLDDLVKFDLYTTLLHEFTHILGFFTAIGEDSSNNITCVNEGSSFTRYDWLFGYYGDILNPSSFSGNKLLIGSESNPTINESINTSVTDPIRRANIWINNQGAPENHLLLSGHPPVNSSETVPNGPVGLSHFGGFNIFPTRQQFSPGKYTNYVMNYSLEYQEVKRQWTLPEIRMILQLGYSLNPNFSSASTLSPPNSNDEVINNSPPYRSDYNSALDFLTAKYFYPVADHLSFPENRTPNFTIINSNTAAQPNISSLSMSIASDNTLVDNDGDPVSVDPETVFGIRGVSDGGNNHNLLQLDATGTVFTYTPEPGYAGRAEFGFQLWDGKELGAMEVYTIEVTRDPTLTYSQDEEMVINGDFEDGTETRTWEEPNKYYTTHNHPQQPNLNNGMLHSGGHPFGISLVGHRLLHSWDDLPGYIEAIFNNGFGYYGTIFTNCPVHNYPYPSNSTPANKRYYTGTTPMNLISRLKYAMVPGEDYILTLDIAFPDITFSGSSIFDIGDIVSNYKVKIIDEPVDLENTVVFQTINPVIAVNTLTVLEIPSEWQTVSIPFTYCGDDEAYNIMLERILMPGGLNTITFFDNISLKIDPNPPVFIIDAGEDIYLSASCDDGQLLAEPSHYGCQLTYSWSPTTGLSDPNILNPVANPTETTTYTITVTDQSSGETATDEVTVFVIPPEITNDGPIELSCFDEPIDLTNHVSSTGGEFFLGADPLTNGVLDPNMYGEGTYTAVYQLGEGDCVAYSFFEVTINEIVLENFGDLVLECVDNSIDLTTNVNYEGGTFISGSLTLDDGILNPTWLGAGTHNVTYFLSDEMCVAVTNFSVTVNPLPLDNFGDLFLDCEDISYDLNTNVSVAGGTFAANGVNIPNGIFYTAQFESGVYTIVYQMPENSCYGSTSFSLTIPPNDEVTNYGDITICMSDEIIDLFQNVSEIGGIFFVNEQIITDGLFDPTVYGEGVYLIEYQIGAEPCDVSTFFSITVNGNANATNPNGLTVTDGGPNDGTTLSGNLQFLDDLVIENGAVFTLSNAQIQFAEGKGVHIQTGGKLFIENNSYLENLACGNHWAGIYVNGDDDYSQVPAEANHQGQCFINNSTIENAIRGITNYGEINNETFGGIFRCLNTTFRNCEISADIRQFNNISPYNGAQLPIQSRFYNCDFVWDEDFQFINNPGNPMINLFAVNQVTISGCTFTNTNSEIFNYPNNSSEKAAIFAFKASINLSRGCNGLPPYAMNEFGFCVSGDVPSTISGFNYGVVLYGGGGSSITKTDFNCYRGLWALYAPGFQLTQNNFGNLPSNLIPFSGQNNGNDPIWQVNYGAYLEGTTKFWVEENDFDYPLTPHDAGLIIRAAGAGYNNAYRNTFNKTVYGAIAYDDNRGLSETTGLKYECNTFTGNLLSITAYPTIQNPPAGWGISKVQGVPPFGTDPYGIPAGNDFIGDNIYNVFNTLEQVIYFTHPSENLQTYLGITPVPLSNSNQCPSSFPSPFGKEGIMATHKAKADSIHTALASIVDDGDTQGLTNEVVLADYGEAVELYYDLMQVSPNLSEEVMIEAINKEFELPAALLTLILKSNPHAAKSGRIQKELDERMSPLETYQRSMIDQGLELVSYKEGLEAAESYHRSRYDFLLNQVIFEILTDTTNTNKISSIISAIDGYETVDHYYLIIDLFLEAGKIANAQNWLDAIATDFNLDPRRDAEYADFIAVYSILFDKATTGDTSLTQNEQNTLELIAYRHSTLAAGLAKVTLYGYTGIPFLETLIEPETPLTPKSMAHGAKAPEIKSCKVYPNPTAGILMLEIPREFEKTEATVRDASGKVVHRQTIDNGMVTLNLRALASGSYILRLQASDGLLDETHQIQIAK